MGLLLFGVLEHLGGMVVGAGDVGAVGLAAVQDRGVGLGSAGVAERLVAGVVAEQEGPLVLEDGEPGVVEQGSGLAVGGDDAAVAVVLAGCCVDEPPGGRPGDPLVVLDCLVQVAEAVVLRGDLVAEESGRAGVQGVGGRQRGGGDARRRSTICWPNPLRGRTQ
ncbi:hypothetical protein ACPPVO_23085 [Dactylosporangium sp. McL0621]|uniref:hypothetical protein n=1 Tax=Dactylosporangium sp. McL0621 TaxID=3415678 RepID=UPI003CE88FFD